MFIIGAVKVAGLSPECSVHKLLKEHKLQILIG